MKKNTDETVVVFRKFKEKNALGDVIALFPELDEGRGMCASYMHVGQHSAASYDGLLCMTQPAQPQEYEELKAELEKIGYKLKIRRRRP